MAGRVWSEKELDQRSLRRLSILRHAEEVSGSVAATGRHYGISRNVFYTWKRRCGEAGLNALRDRSSAPHSMPNATSTEIVGKIIHVRRPCHLGPNRIQMYLKRHHGIEISTSGIRQILKRLDMNRLPASQRHKRTATKWKRSRSSSQAMPFRST